MLNVKQLREDCQAISDRLASRGFLLDVNQYQQLESQRKQLQQQVERLQAERNRMAKHIGNLKAQGQAVDELMQQVAGLAQQLASSKHQLQAVQQSLAAIHESLPNLPAERVPVGQSEADNREVARWGNPTEFDFDSQDHVALAEQRGWLDLATASQLATSRFSLLKGGLARLHRALAQFMLDYHIEHHGYQEISPPYIVNQATLYGTAQLPKFKQDLFAVENADPEHQEERAFYLIPTAEVPLTNLVSGQMLEPDSLPLRWVAHTPCFRSEAGNSGRDTRGLIRQHQFDKVELVNICQPSQSWHCLEQMVEQAEAILQQLELPYRKIILCTADMGFAAALTYDLEVWLPSQQTYREISSLSNCLDFQARRMQARFKNKQGQREYVHSLNGSGLAVGRTLVAVLENHQQADGTIRIPPALRPYLKGQQQL